MDKHELRLKLTNLPDETEDAWLFELTDMAVGLESADHGLLKALYECPLELDTVRFAAFFGSMLLLRRNFDYGEFRTRLDQNVNTFRKHPMLLALRAQRAELSGTDPDRLHEALRFAEQALAKLSASVVLKAQVAHLLICGLKPSDGQDESRRTKLTRALALINEAIDHHPYARYFITKAQTHLLLGEHAAARDAVARGMEMEPAAAKDFAIRIGRFQQLQGQIDIDMAMRELRSAQAVHLKELNDVKAASFEVLGLLAAVMAIVLTTMQIAWKANDFREAVALMFVVTGAIICAFSVFGIVLGSSGRLRQRLFAFVVGLAFMVSPLAFPPSLWHAKEKGGAHGVSPRRFGIRRGQLDQRRSRPSRAALRVGARRGYARGGSASCERGERRSLAGRASGPNDDGGAREPAGAVP